MDVSRLCEYVYCNQGRQHMRVGKLIYYIRKLSLFIPYTHNSIISKISYFWVFLLLLDFQHACLEYYFYCLLYSKLSIRFLNDIHYSCDIHITANNKLVRINLRFEFEPQKLNHGDVLSFDTRQNATNSVARGRNNTLLY